jgi:hypothetical protein
LLRSLSLLPVLLALSACGSSLPDVPEIPELPRPTEEQLAQLKVLECQVKAMSGFVNGETVVAIAVVKAIKARDVDRLAGLLAEAGVALERIQDLANAWNACGGAPHIGLAAPPEENLQDL